MLAMASLEKALRWIAIGGVFLLPVLVPLLVSGSLFFPYITGKNFAFRIIIEIMAASWLALAIVVPAYRPRRSWIIGAFALFITIIALADAFGAVPFKSFWSNYERMDGWVTIAHVFLYLLVTSSVMNTEKLWRALFYTSLAVSAYLGIYGLLQAAGISALGQGGAAGLAARVDGTFGNPIYFAVYMLFHVFIAAHLWARSWIERGRGNRLPLSILYGALIALDTFVLFFTGTRGTMLGLIGGVLLTAILLVLLARNSRNVWRMSVGAIVALLILIGGFWLIRDAAWVNKVGFLQRLATISLEENTVKARFINWSMAWKGVQERPLLGWGQENYALVFDKYYDPRMYAQEPWFDRVHNVIFDWLVAGGFLGLIAYLSIFAATVWTLWRGNSFTISERAIFTGLLAAYFCHNFFVFDNVVSYLFFGTILAYIVHRTTDKKPTVGESVEVSRSALPYIAVLMVLVLWGSAWLVNHRALASNRALLQALASTEGGLPENLRLFEKSISYGSLGTQEAREQLAQGATGLAGAQIATSTKIAFYEAAVRQMEQQSLDSPLDARFPLFLGLLHDAYGNLSAGAAALQKAHELSPTKQSILFEMGRNAFDRGDRAAGIRHFKLAFELEPRYVTARTMYAAALIAAGQDALADEILAPIIESGEAADQRILGIYVQRKQYAKAAALWEARVKAMPQDAQSYFTLAAIYYEAGNRAQALATLERVQKAIPSVAAQAAAFIQEMQGNQ